MDVNVEIDELVLHRDADGEELADRIRTATGGALASGMATQVSHAVLTAVSERRGPAGSGGEGRQP